VTVRSRDEMATRTGELLGDEARARQSVPGAPGGGRALRVGIDVWQIGICTAACLPVTETPRKRASEAIQSRGVDLTG